MSLSFPLKQGISRKKKKIEIERKWFFNAKTWKCKHKHSLPSLFLPYWNEEDDDDDDEKRREKKNKL